VQVSNTLAQYDKTGSKIARYMQQPWLPDRGGRVMTSWWRSAIAAFVVMLVTAAAPGPVAAQQADLNAILSRFKEFYAAGKL
jgi:hypothetical protein